MVLEGGCTCLVLGGVPVWSEGVYQPGPRGGVPTWYWGGVPAWSWRGVPAWSRRGVPAWSQGGTWSRGCIFLVPGGCTWSGGYLPGPGGCTWSGTSPPVDRMTHVYENITLPQTSFVGGNKLVSGQDVSTRRTKRFILESTESRPQKYQVNGVHSDFETNYRFAHKFQNYVYIFQQ